MTDVADFLESASQSYQEAGDVLGYLGDRAKMLGQEFPTREDFLRSLLFNGLVLKVLGSLVEELGQRAVADAEHRLLAALDELKGVVGGSQGD